MAKPLIAIVGETGSGKSELALKLAKERGGEIICADAWTVRKGMDIGTAKPSQKDRQEIPHHLLDIVLPNEPFSAAKFKNLVNVVIKDIHKRNKVPILVGGNGLYIDSIIYNYSFLTTDSKTSRNALNNKSVSELLSLIAVEHISLSNIDPSNKRRLIRLIETNGEQSSRDSLKANTLILGLKIDKQSLEKRLVSRLDKMIEVGLEREVRQLSQRFGWQAEVLKGVGYREWQEYFSGTINLDQLKERIIKDSIQLAKKQRTWFKRNQDINWLITPVKWEKVVELITTFIDSQVL